MWGEIIYPFPNFNGTTDPIKSLGWNYLSIPKLKGAAHEVWELVCNFIPHFMGHVITYIHAEITVDKMLMNKYLPISLTQTCAIRSDY